MRDITSPQFLGELWTMVSKTGKGINDLGDPVTCSTDELEYILLKVTVDPGFTAVRIGMCSPKQCNNNYYYGNILAILEAFFDGQKGIKNPKAFVEVPSEVQTSTLNTGAIIVVV